PEHIFVTQAGGDLPDGCGTVVLGKEGEVLVVYLRTGGRDHRVAGLVIILPKGTGDFVPHREGTPQQRMGKDGTGSDEPVVDPVVGAYGAVVLLLTALGDVRPGALGAAVVVAVEVDCQLAEGAAVIAVEP